MSSRTLPNLGLKAFFTIGEDGWSDEIDANFLKLSTLVNGAVLSVVTSKPTVVNQGDIYLMSNSATSNANTVAVYDNLAWTHYAPRTGWNIYNIATDSMMTWNGTAWLQIPLQNLRSLSAIADTLGVVEQTADGVSGIRAIGVAAADNILTRSLGDARFATVGHTHPQVGVQAFNTREGAVTLLSADVTTALGFTPVEGNATLTALKALGSSVGLVEQTGATTFTKRAIGAAADTDIPTRLDNDARYESKSAKLTSVAALSLTGNAGKVVKVNIGEDGFTLGTDIAGGGGGDGTWGAIDGTIGDQTDLTLALNQRQPIDDGLTGLAAMATTVGIVEQTAANTFGIRLVGVANATDLLTRAGGDARYQGIGSYQASSINLTALAGLNATSGILEQTATATFTKRAIGVANATDLLTRAGGDGRFAALAHSHAITDVTGLQAALTSKQDAAANLTGLGALTLTGGAGKVIAVNSGATGFELITPSAGGALTEGDYGDITVGTGTLTIDAGAVTLAKMAALPANRFLGNNTGSTATPIALTVAQTKTMLALAIADVTGLQTALDGKASTANFGSGVSGLVPPSGGGTTNFLRADGVFAAPPGGGSGVTDGDKGDVTVSGSGATWTIDANAVTLAKMAQVATATFLGRTTASTGNVEALTVSQAKTLLALVKADVGLGSVDNTSDAGKPISTATQTAITALDERIGGAINAQTGTTFTPVLTDANDYVELTNSSAITVTIPNNSTVAYPVGTVITFEQGGAGPVTISTAGGVTLQQSPLFTATTNGIHAVAQIKKKATNTWIVFGNLVAV